MEASADLVLKSESIYIDILKSGGSAPFIGTMMSFPDGRIFTEDHLVPRLEAGQYEQVKFDFVAYDPDATPAQMDVYRDGVKTQSVSVARTTQTYTNRFTEQGEITMKFKTGATEYPFYIDVTESGIDLQENYRRACTETFGSRAEQQRIRSGSLGLWRHTYDIFWFRLEQQRLDG